MKETEKRERENGKWKIFFYFGKKKGTSFFFSISLSLTPPPTSTFQMVHLHKLLGFALAGISGYVLLGYPGEAIRPAVDAAFAGKGPVIFQTQLTVNFFFPDSSSSSSSCLPSLALLVFFRYFPSYIHPARRCLPVHLLRLFQGACRHHLQQIREHQCPQCLRRHPPLRESLSPSPSPPLGPYDPCSVLMHPTPSIYPTGLH